MKWIVLVVLCLVLPIGARAGTGTPPACMGGAYTDECLDFGDSSQIALVQHRLDSDENVGTGAPIEHRSEQQKAEIMRLFRAVTKVERENSILKHRRKCPGSQ